MKPAQGPGQQPKHLKTFTTKRMNVCNQKQNLQQPHNTENQGFSYNEKVTLSFGYKISYRTSFWFNTGLELGLTGNIK